MGCPERDGIAGQRGGRQAVDHEAERRYVAARPRDWRHVLVEAGKELNIAQHARRQAAILAAQASRFFCWAK